MSVKQTLSVECLVFVTGKQYVNFTLLSIYCTMYILRSCRQPLMDCRLRKRPTGKGVITGAAISKYHEANRVTTSRRPYVVMSRKITKQAQ